MIIFKRSIINQKSKYWEAPLMKKQTFYVFCILFVMISGCSYFSSPAAYLDLPAVFGDNMVLQQNINAPIWGKATPGGKVTILFESQKKTAIASRDSLWQVKLESLTAGGPYEMRIIGADTITFKNVMVGEVWICSGQSNMEMPLADWGKVLNYEQEIKDANYPDIRLFHVFHTKSMSPKDNVNSEGWKSCSPVSIPNFSSTAYFFGRHLHEKLGVPVGLIHTSWGGTVAEAWTSGDYLKKMPYFKNIVEQLESGGQAEQEFEKEYNENLIEWWKKIELKVENYQTKKGENWHVPELNTSTWKKMTLPVRWEDGGMGEYDGVVWFRKTVNIPSTWIGKDLNLNLGPINDHDITWFNGHKLGSHKDSEYPRRYPVPASIIKPGRNVIAVRVLDIGGSGGIWGSAKELYLELESGVSIPLAGQWSYCKGMEMWDIPPMPQSIRAQNLPTVLYNAMLHPLIPYAMRGAIWYQGESNASRAYQYQTLFQTLIQDWRSKWGQGDFPFLFVQLANFKNIKSQPANDDWAELREAQLMALSLPNTGLAVAIDIGDELDIHPKNKQEVGRRLALNALSIAYEKDIDYSGPIYKSMTIESNKIRLAFEHADQGLVASNGSELKGFAIAGSDKNFYWADAVIDGQKCGGFQSTGGRTCSCPVCLGIESGL